MEIAKHGEIDVLCFNLESATAKVTMNHSYGCSLLARRASWAWHKIWVLFDVVNIRGERLEWVLSSKTILTSSGGQFAWLKCGHLGLKSGDALVLSYVLSLVS